MRLSVAFCVSGVELGLRLAIMYSPTCRTELQLNSLDDTTGGLDVPLPDVWLHAQPTEVDEAEPEPETEPVSGFTMATPAAANAAKAEAPAESGFKSG
jgi:hypothetical protein